MMQNVVESVYKQTSVDNRDVLTTVVKQHMAVIELFGSAEVQSCLDMDQVEAIRTELQAINASLHTIAERQP